MPTRSEYYLDLHGFIAEPARAIHRDIRLKTVDEKDVFPLAELMLDAFVGTIDYEGETLLEARAELEKFLQGNDQTQPLLQHSLLAMEGDQILSACLTSVWVERPYPWISYVMTNSQYKNRGLGISMVSEVLTRLWMAGHGAVGAMITEGNQPSEKIFSKLGFVKL